MRDTFSEWLAKSPYHWYGRSKLSVSDRKIVDMMRAAFKAGTQSDELDRAAELLRRASGEMHVVGSYRDNAETAGLYVTAKAQYELATDIDAFLREIEG